MYAVMLPKLVSSFVSLILPFKFVSGVKTVPKSRLDVARLPSRKGGSMRGERLVGIDMAVELKKITSGMNNNNSNNNGIIEPNNGRYSSFTTTQSLPSHSVHARSATRIKPPVAGQRKPSKF